MKINVMNKSVLRSFLLAVFCFGLIACASVGGDMTPVAGQTDTYTLNVYNNLMVCEGSCTDNKAKKLATQFMTEHGYSNYTIISRKYDFNTVTSKYIYVIKYTH